MNGVNVIEFNEQQKVRLAAALRAVAGEQLQPETVDTKPLIHDGGLLRPANEDATGKESTRESGEQSCEEGWEFLPIKQEIDTLENTTPSQHETLISAKYEEQISPAQSVAAELAPASSSATIDAAARDVKAIVMSSHDFNLRDNTMPIDAGSDDSCDEDEMQPETEQKLKELMASDAEDEMPVGSVNKLYDQQKKIDMLMHYICPQCNYACGSYRKWRAHTFNEHNFNSIEQLNMRRLVDSVGKMLYQCNECHMKFSQNSQFSPLLDHRITHLPFPDYLKCRLCDARFLRRRLLARHLKTLKHEEIYKEYLAAAPKFRHYMELHCPLCDALQPSRKRWEGHLNKKHNYSASLVLRMSIVLQNGSERFCCNACKKQVGQLDRLTHSVTHERYGLYKCKFCHNFRSFDIECGWRHIRKMHLCGPTKVVPCSYCELTFLSNKSRYTHLRNQHRLDKMQCEMCEQQFSFAASLLAHMNKSKHHRLVGVETNQLSDLKNATDEETSCESVDCYDKVVKEEPEIAVAGGVPSAAPAVAEDAGNSTAAEELKSCNNNNNDFGYKNHIIEPANSSDEEEMDMETELKLEELSASDEEHDEPAHTSDSSIVKLCNKEKNIDSLMHYFCPECNQHCGSLKKWQVHTSNAHNFNSIEQLNMRSFVDSAGKLCYQCNDCQLQFSQKTQYSPLLDHRIMHMPHPDYLKCRLCEARFVKRKLLVQHLKRRKHEKIYKGYLNSKSRFRHYMELFCPLCDAPQANRKQWEAHLNKKHKYSAIIAQRMVEDESSNRYCCNECNKTYAKQKCLEHSLSHERYESYKCKLCSTYRSFYFWRCWIHVRTVHLGEANKVVRCSYCESTFSSNGGLKKHLRSVHRKDKLKCEMCKLQFSTATRLLAHMNKSKHYRLDGEVTNQLSVAVDKNLKDATDEESNCGMSTIEIVKEEAESVAADNKLPSLKGLVMSIVPGSISAQPNNIEIVTTAGGVKGNNSNNNGLGLKQEIIDSLDGSD